MSKTVAKMCRKGTLALRVGPMFSGKTTWLNSELTILVDMGYNVLRIGHVKDVRTASSNVNGMTTHNSSYTELSSRIHNIVTDTLSRVDTSGFTVIGIDEAQLYPDLVEVVTDWVENKGLHVKVVGLCGDSFKRPFGDTLKLIPLCDEVHKLQAYCIDCKNLSPTEVILNKAPFTKRLVASTEQVLIGGADTYAPVCRLHHS